MSYTYNDAEELEDETTVGTKQCVALVKAYAGAPASSLWKEGVAVKGNKEIKKGTAIATFVNGRYPNLRTGNHAALFLSQDEQGIWVIDQWSSSRTIRKSRYLFLGKNEDGTYVSPSKNADAYSIVE